MAKKFPDKKSLIVAFIEKDKIVFITVNSRDPGLDLRVEHSHGWGENSQVGFLVSALLDFSLI